MEDGGRRDAGLSPFWLAAGKRPAASGEFYHVGSYRVGGTGAGLGWAGLGLGLGWGWGWGWGWGCVRGCLQGVEDGRGRGENILSSVRARHSREA